MKLANDIKELGKFRHSVIFTYSTEHLPKKDKVRFYYALKGRDGKTGIVKRCSIEQLGRTVLLVPTKFAQDAHGFLQYWKCEYQSRDVFVKNHSLK
jgi:hypothetical protein